jgi:hypothetical protein
MKRGVQLFMIGWFKRQAISPIPEDRWPKQVKAWVREMAKEASP